MHTRSAFIRWRGRVVVGTIVLLILLLVGIGIHVGHAGEIIPAVGWTKPIHGDDDPKVFGGVSFRNELLPLVNADIGVAYRSESRLGDRLKLHMWPVTLSAYLTPLPMIYAGAGVGWYHITYDYDNQLALSDETKQEFGVHVAGGAEFPLAPIAAIDLNVRYVMMRDQQSRLVPEKFDPDFWSTSVGIAFKY